ncbi:MAG: fasciclin domain-containing protein [Gracilimonas sp.]
MKFSKKLLTGFATMLIALFVGLGAVQAQDDVVEVVQNSEDHTIFAELLEETEMVELLKEEGPYTVLAPTDEAFESLGDELETLKENPQELQNVVIGHLFNGQIGAADVEEARSVNVTQGDIEASNGTVHVIDEVMVE